MSNAGLHYQSIHQYDPEPVDRLKHCRYCKIETAIDNENLRFLLRRVAADYMELARREGKRMDVLAIYQVMLFVARNVRDVRKEFELAKTHPRMTGGTVAELRAKLYAMVVQEARELARAGGRWWKQE